MKRTANVLAGLALAGAVLLFGWALRTRPVDRQAPGPEKGRYLIAKAHSPDVATQCAAIAELGASRDAQSFPVLLDKLRSPEPNVREAAVRALGVRGDRDAVEPLTQVLGDRVTRVRFSALRALARLADPRALPALKRQMNSGKPLAADAALAIGCIRTPEAESILIEALSSPAMNVRLGAIHGLANCGTARAIPPLERLIAEPLSGIEPAFLARAKSVGEDIEPSQVAEPCGRAIEAIKARLKRGGS